MKALIIIAMLGLSTWGCSTRGGETLPSFDLLLSDSTTTLHTADIREGNPIALLFFSPDCEHCQHETETIIHHMDSLKGVRFFFITNDPLDRLKMFDHVYKLNKYSNITLAWDNQFLFPRHFKGAYPPYLVIYDRDRRMRGAFEGGLEANKMIQFVNSL